MPSEKISAYKVFTHVAQFVHDEETLRSLSQTSKTLREIVSLSGTWHFRLKIVAPELFPSSPTSSSSFSSLHGVEELNPFFQQQMNNKKKKKTATDAAGTVRSLHERKLVRERISELIQHNNNNEDLPLFFIENPHLQKEFLNCVVAVIRRNPCWRLFLSLKEILSSPAISEPFLGTLYLHEIFVPTPFISQYSLLRKTTIKYRLASASEMLATHPPLLPSSNRKKNKNRNKRARNRVQASSVSHRVAAWCLESTVDKTNQITMAYSVSMKVKAMIMVLLASLLVYFFLNLLATKLASIQVENPLRIPISSSSSTMSPLSSSSSSSSNHVIGFSNLTAIQSLSTTTTTTTVMTPSTYQQQQSTDGGATTVEESKSEEPLNFIFQFFVNDFNKVRQGLQDLLDGLDRMVIFEKLKSILSVFPNIFSLDKDTSLIGLFMMPFFDWRTYQAVGEIAVKFAALHPDIPDALQFSKDSFWNQLLEWVIGIVFVCGDIYSAFYYGAHSFTEVQVRVRNSKKQKEEDKAETNKKKGEEGKIRKAISSKVKLLPRMFSVPILKHYLFRQLPLDLSSYFIVSVSAHLLSLSLPILVVFFHVFVNIPHWQFLRFSIGLVLDLALLGFAMFSSDPSKVLEQGLLHPWLSNWFTSRITQKQDFGIFTALRETQTSSLTPLVVLGFSCLVLIFQLSAFALVTSRSARNFPGVEIPILETSANPKIEDELLLNGTDPLFFRFLFVFIPTMAIQRSVDEAAKKYGSFASVVESARVAGILTLVMCLRYIVARLNKDIWLDLEDEDE